MKTFIEILTAAQMKGYKSPYYVPINNEVLQLALILQWLRDNHNAHIDSVTSVNSEGKAVVYYNVLIIYPPDVVKFPKSNYSTRECKELHLLTAIDTALNYIN